MNSGQLYIVATPIGNLNDITFRAIEVLKNVDLILSEDTRETSKILRRFNIEKPQLSYRDQNHNKILPEIINLLENGKNLALVSDSGTPLISDPGFKLVRELLNRGFKVESIPGPSALISALVASGLPTDKFAFLGFLPKGSGQQKAILEAYGKLDATLIIYESPYRIKKLLETLRVVLGNRQVCIANELTKLHEKLIHGDLQSIIDSCVFDKLKGEFVVLVAKTSFK